MAGTDLSGRLTWGRGPRLALALVAGITAIGTLGYMVIEGWSVWDAFYMTIISVTTVGYGYPRPLSRAGEIWTTLVLLAGVSALFYTASLVMALMVEGGLYRRIEARRFTRMLDTLTDHYIICGYGRIGSIIADEFRKQRIPYVVVDRDPERVHQVMELGGMAVQADASREDVLLKVGVERARGLIAAVGTDAENVYTVLTARVLRTDLFIIARVEMPDAEA
ncbi:MAG: potassium channel family protein [Vicinamibacterales bacterium]